MKVLVIGSKGFIGSNLFRHLSEKHYDVWGADVVADNSGAAKFFQLDSTNSLFPKIFQIETFDVCVNCSGVASVPDSLQDPLRDFSLNSTNVFRILDAIRLFQPGCRFLNISSAAVYGNPVNLPVKETDETKPVSPYGMHKLMSEQICREFYNFFRIPTLSVRVFSAYGEGQKKQLFYDLYQKAQKNNGKEIELYGTGRESRDFIHIKDLVMLIELLIQKAAFDGSAINGANGKEVYIEEAVKMFFDLFERPVPYRFIGSTRQGDPINWAADTGKLNDMGYRPGVTLNEGLKKYYTWLTQNV